MSFGFGFGFPKNYIATLFNPAQLFTGTTNGAWYDPSDLTTLFQDSAGTTPVTAVEQPVGLMLDKSKGLVLGSEINAANFTNWTVSGFTYAAGILSYAKGGGVTAYPQTTVFPTLSSIVKVSIFVTAISGAVQVANQGGAQTVSLVSGQNTFFLRPGSDLKMLFIFPAGSSISMSSFSIRELPGNHAFNPSGSPPPASGNSANFPVLQQDGTGRYYLAFNGVNQWLQTNSIDFTYGDKMFVCAGVRKLSDAALGMLAEISSGGAIGSFQIRSPNSASATHSFTSIGTSGVTAASAETYAAPITNVVSGIGNISGDQAILRVNGTQAAISTADQGTGNYGNYPLYIGARAGTSLWFNGRLYGLVVAGKQASASEIASTEAWLNNKTGAY